MSMRRRRTGRRCMYFEPIYCYLLSNRLQNVIYNFIRQKRWRKRPFPIVSFPLTNVIAFPCALHSNPSLPPPTSRTSYSPRLISIADFNLLSFNRPSHRSLHSFPLKFPTFFFDGQGSASSSTLASTSPLGIVFLQKCTSAFSRRMESLSNQEIKRTGFSIEALRLSSGTR